MVQPWQQVLDEIKAIKGQMDLLTKGQRDLTQGQRDLQASFDEVRSQSKGGAGPWKNSDAVACDPINGNPGKNLEIPQCCEGPNSKAKVACDPINGNLGNILEAQVSFETPTTPAMQGSASSRTRRSVLTDGSRSYEMAEENLRKVLRINKETEEIDREISQKTRRIGKPWTTHGFRLNKFLLSLDAHGLEHIVDSIVAPVIFCNAVFVGVSLDYEDDSLGWLVAQFIFAIIFWTELLLKLKLHGFKWYCRSSEKSGLKTSNIFDTCIVLADTVQIFLELRPDAWGILGDTPISIFRLLRLIRLIRLLRLLQSSVFNDLFAMVQGLTCGISTIGWAVVVFLVVIYLVALICKEVMGSVDPGQEVEDPATMESFNTVPQALFTVFRCSFGDCSTLEGKPLFVSNGPFWAVLYSLFTFIVVVGIFNVISAIFVESTLNSAKNVTADKLRARLDNPKVFSVNVTKVLKALLQRQCLDMADIEGLEKGKCSDEFFERLSKSEFPRSLFEEVVREDDEVKEALSALDINSEENAHLSDILDPDNGGSVGCMELVDGLDRLRGEPRRGDIIAVDLMIRSLQLQVDEIRRSLQDIKSQSSRVPVTWRDTLAVEDIAGFTL